MRKIITSLFSLALIVSCSSQVNSGAEAPTEIIPPTPSPEPMVTSAPTAFSITEGASSIEIPSTIVALTPGVYPITYSEEGFHVRSLMGEELVFIPSPGFGPGEASPDGRYLIITQPDVILINLSTGEIETYSEFLPGFYPSWNPASELLVYTSVEDGHDFASLFVLDFGKEDMKRVTFGKGFEEMPSWSPNGVSIVYAADSEDRPLGSTELYIIEVVCIETESCDEDARHLEDLPDDEYAYFPTWSPTGDQIAYLCGDNGDTNICIYDFSNNDRSKLISDVSQHSMVKWSPDDTWIGFSRQGVDGNMSRAIIYDLNSGEERAISSTDREEFFSAWLVVR